MQALFTKQGREAQFKTEEERDAWVHKEIGQLEATIARKQQNLAALTADTQQLNSELMELSQVRLDVGVPEIAADCAKRHAASNILSRSLGLPSLAP